MSLRGKNRLQTNRGGKIQPDGAAINLAGPLALPLDWKEWSADAKQQFLDHLKKKAIITDVKDAKVYTEYQKDPVGYAENVLKNTLTEDQKLILNSVRDNRRTLVKASHAIGKTHCCGILSNWWYDCWDQHIVYITAPTWAQALGLTFKQVKSQRRKNRLGGRILDSGRILDFDQLKEPGHFIKALNAETGEGFQGEHTAPILIIIEEGVGVPHYIWEAVEGLMTHPDNRIVVVGNPTDAANDFGQACDDGSFFVLTVSALDHPNIKAELNCEKAPFPDAVRLLWLYELLSRETDVVSTETIDTFKFWSLPVIDAALNGRPVTPESEQVMYLPTAFFQGRALGQFPTQLSKQVIPKAWLTKLQPLEWTKEDMPEIGCDIARFGDDRTGIATRIGPCLLRLRELRKMDTVVVENELKEEALYAARMWRGQEWWDNEAHTDEHKLRVAKTIPIKIDVTGGLGAGPFDHLLAEGYTAVGINSSQRAHNVEQYKNVRSELWFEMQGRVKEMNLDLSRVPKDLRDKLILELSGTKYEIKDKKIVEDKSILKDRLGFSPDLADTVNICYTTTAIVPPKVAAGGVSQKSSWQAETYSNADTDRTA